jgi:uncharacterized protein YndB with AHSA1/START domain
VDLRKTCFIGAPPADVWRALTDPALIDLWGGGPAEMSAEPGSEFSLWGGDIHGTVIAADPPVRLVEEWWGGSDWPAASTAVFELRPQGDGTLLVLEHTGVPDDEAPDFDAGWDDYYLGPLKEMLEETDVT